MERKAVFYLISDDSLKARDLYACRITEKAFTNKHKVYIHTSNPEETQTIDDQLWTFRDISFLPHKIYNGATLSPITESILVGHLPPPKNFSEILINLNSSVPDFHSQFTHIIEIAPNNPELRAIARKHYKYYQQQNYAMENHNLA